MIESRRSVLDIVTPRRLVITAVLLLAAVLSVVGLQRTNTSVSSVPCGTSGAIVHLLPCPGDSGLTQGTIGVDLAPGWQADLYLDGTPVPRDELSVEGSNYYFRPGPGTATGALAPGAHTVRVVYYHDLADESSGQQYSWSFYTR